MKMGQHLFSIYIGQVLKISMLGKYFVINYRGSFIAKKLLQNHTFDKLMEATNITHASVLLDK